MTKTNDDDLVTMWEAFCVAKRREEEDPGFGDGLAWQQLRQSLEHVVELLREEVQV